MLDQLTWAPVQQASASRLRSLDCVLQGMPLEAIISSRRRRVQSFPVIYQCT